MNERTVRIYSGWILQHEYDVTDLNMRDLAEFERYLEAGMPEGWHLVSPDDLDDDFDDDTAHWSPPTEGSAA